MAGNLSDIQTANINFLKIFLYGVKNSGPQYKTPEMKMQKMSFPWLYTESDDLFSLRNAWHFRKTFRACYKICQTIICYWNEIVG